MAAFLPAFLPAFVPRLALAACAALASAVQAEDVATPPLQLSLGEGGTSIYASGRWITKVRRGNGFPLAAVNSVSLRCTRGSMTCTESRAELMPVLDAKQAGVPPTLTVRSIAFKVTEWSDARLIARTDTESADLMLRIDLQRRQVDLSYWDAKPDLKPGTAEGFAWTLH
jgi:hypothetical protein